MFEIKPLDPETYRSQTRRNGLIVAAFFAVLAMLLSQLAVKVLGTPGGDNFRWNLGGVLAGVVVTGLLVRYHFSRQPWMAMSVYGWQLKRSLMSITNVMHKVTERVAANDPDAIRLLRFYHLGVMQMHRLENNSSDLLQMRAEIVAHEQRMQALGLELEQTRLDPAWLAALKTA
jgi:hypothetical protein